jgi:hypothetical protein
VGHQEIVGFRRWVGLVCVAVGLVVVAACAAIDTRPAPEVVTERAQKRWDALVKGDLREAYGYFSPASRSSMTLEEYGGSIRAGFWKAAQVQKVDCEKPEICEVAVLIEYDFRGSRIKTPLAESWIKEGTSWWYVRK